MIATWLILVAPASATEVESQTVIQARSDLFGESMIPAHQYLRLADERGGVRVDGYAALQWSSGLDRPADPDLYLLSAAGGGEWGSWTIGRQQAVSVIRPWTFDGARVVYRPVDGLQLGAWAGWARHQDLNDLTDGVGVGRLEARWARGPLAARAGGQLELGPDGDPGVREDLEVWLTPSKLPLDPTVRALVITSAPSTTPEWARLELGASPVSRLRATAHVQHRESVDPSALLGEAIAAAFAPDGVDEAGLGLRVANARWAALSATYAVSRYQEQDTEVWGHSVDASYTPGRRGAIVQLVPGYRFAAGPGGLYHALHATGSVALGDASSASLKGAIVPYRKLHDPWATALTGGVDIDRWFTQMVNLSGGVDLASDANYQVDLRGTVVLTVEMK